MSTAADRALRSGRQGSPWVRSSLVTVTGGDVDLDTVKMQLRAGPNATAELLASSFDHDTLGVALIDLTGTGNDPKRLRWTITGTDTATFPAKDLWMHTTATTTVTGEDPVENDTIGYYLFKCLPRVLVS